MVWKKGESGNPKGKPLGAKSKVSKLKEAYVKVFEGLGGMKALKTWVESDAKNKSDFYKLLPQLMPRESNVTIDTELTADDRAIQATNSLLAEALGNRPAESDDSQPNALPH